LDIGDLQTNWDQLGRTDPFWAILSVPEKIHGGWDPKHFFSTGVDEISGVLQYLKTVGAEPVPGNALDFGCGVGRLTQAMCQHFDHCCGIDIAPSMIDLATRYNRFGARCRYHLNCNDTLADFADNSWQFVYSNLVLQHMKPEYSKKYVREFLRVLSPDGVLLFQLPAEPKVAPAPESGKGRLSAAGFSASIAPRISMLTAAASSAVELVLDVQNTSSQTWSAAPEHVIALGNHWRNRAGELLVLDDGRAPLPVSLEPGGKIEMRLQIRTPPEPGDYILELDMVQEFVAWFADKGSAVHRMQARIHARNRARNPAVNPDVPTSATSIASKEADPVIEMYGVPKQQILEIIAAGGGTVVDLQQDLNAGAEWTSYRYCVRKGRR
jgi:SAM-dependent methyltransferase